jgi:hypothetical protein
MNMFRSALNIGLISIALWPMAHGASDWRVDLLRSQGIPTTRASLEKIASEAGTDEATLNEAYQQLGSESYQKREQAHQYLKSQGNSILGFLKSKEPVEEPEIRKRASEIQKHLESNVASRQNLMVIDAAKSLLKSPKDKSTGGQFYEWFGTESADCTKGYRQLVYEGPKNVKPFIQNSQLVIPGKRPGNADQRMILHCNTWPATKELPKHISVSCLVGSTGEGASTHHLGITIGKVKTLIHPGYRGGGFRFEQIGTQRKFTKNINMGYTPAPKQLHRIKVTAQRMKNGKVYLKAVVSSTNKKPFETSIELDQEDVGEFNQISLDRSGRSGGNVYFDDFRVQIEP